MIEREQSAGKNVNGNGTLGSDLLSGGRGRRFKSSRSDQHLANGEPEIPLAKPLVKDAAACPIKDCRGNFRNWSGTACSHWNCPVIDQYRREGRELRSYKEKYIYETCGFWKAFLGSAFSSLLAPLLLAIPILDSGDGPSGWSWPLPSFLFSVVWGLAWWALYHISRYQRGFRLVWYPMPLDDTHPQQGA